MKKIKNYIRESIKNFILVLLHDYIEKIKEDIKKELMENIGYINKIEYKNETKETLKSKQINEQYVSYPNENIIGDKDKEVKDGTISYDYSGNQIIERVYFDGEWRQPNNNMKEIQVVKNYVNIDKFGRELDKDLVFSSDKSIVITDSLNHDDKYKIVIKSSNLCLEKIN